MAQSFNLLIYISKKRGIFDGDRDEERQVFDIFAHMSEIYFKLAPLVFKLGFDDYPKLPKSGNESSGLSLQATTENILTL